MGGSTHWVANRWTRRSRRGLRANIFEALVLWSKVFVEEVVAAAEADHADELGARRILRRIARLGARTDGASARRLGEYSEERRREIAARVQPDDQRASTWHTCAATFTCQRLSPDTVHSWPWQLYTWRTRAVDRVKQPAEVRKLGNSRWDLVTRGAPERWIASSSHPRCEN